MASPVNTANGVNGGTSTPVTPFSYAQAARGKSASPMTALQTGPKKDALNWGEDNSDARTLVEEEQSKVASVDESRKDTVATIASQQPVQPSRTSSTASPDITASSSSTLKEEDTTSDPKTPDSNGDAKHQASTSIANMQENDEPVIATPTSPDGRQEGKDGQTVRQLREAPIPMVNFWQQRALDAKAKQPQLVATPVASTASVEKANKQSIASSIAPKISSEASSSSQVPPSPSQHQRGGSRAKVTDSVLPRKPRNGKDESAASANVAPPSVQDQRSWPTPLNVQDEDKKKAQERGDKVEKTNSSSKAHPKNEWTKVDFTPSVVFNTPLPTSTRRGGRSGGRGGREPGSRGGSISERADLTSNTTATTGGASESGRRGRSDVNAVRNTVQPDRNKRASSANQAVVAESTAADTKQPSLNDGRSTATGIPAQSSIIPQRSGRPNGDRAAARRSMHAPQLDRNLDSTTLPSATAISPNSVAADVAQTNEVQQIATVLHSEPATLDTSSAQAAFSSDPNADDSGSATLTENTPTERRPDPSARTFDRHSDSWQPTASRERGEGRPERGRGGRGGRGGGHFANLQLNAASQYNMGYQSLPASASRAQSGYQGPMPSQFGYGAPQQQNRRNGPRSASIPSDPSFGRFPNSYFTGTQTSPYPQFGNSAYDYAGVSPVAAVPYDPFLEQAMLMTQLDNQLNYYFSLENMVKDMFLRSHMDSQGFVSMKLITNFKKMKELSTQYELIKYVCLMSPEFEVRPGADGVDKIRKKSDWQRWVLNMDQRDPSAQNDGPVAPDPSQAIFGEGQPHSRSTGPQDRKSPQPGDGSFATIAQAQPFVPPAISSPSNGIGRMPPPLNRHSLSTVENELSFRPNSTPQPAQNGVQAAPGEPDSFTDDQIEGLTVIARPRNAQGERSPIHSSSRTFSNGSIDGQALTNDGLDHDERKSRSRTRRNGPNGPLEGESTSSSRFLDPAHTVLSRSPSSRGSTHEDSNNLYWIKDKESPVPLPSEAQSELYTELRFRALQQHQLAAHGEFPDAMTLLYAFWSHFLIRNFNTRMYDEFRQLAHDDASQRGNDTGMTHLTRYYSEALSSQSPIRERVARHYVQLVLNEDRSKSRVIFDQLRAVWRNGALNLKNRKKLLDMIQAMDPSLREQLDS